MNFAGKISLLIIIIHCMVHTSSFNHSRKLHNVTKLPTIQEHVECVNCVLNPDVAAGHEKKNSRWKRFKSRWLRMKMLIWWTLLGVGVGIILGASLYKVHPSSVAITLIGFPPLLPLVVQVFLCVSCNASLRSTLSLLNACQRSQVYLMKISHKCVRVLWNWVEVVASYVAGQH
jgi:hypothetical protein